MLKAARTRACGSAENPGASPCGTSDSGEPPRDGSDDFAAGAGPWRGAGPDSGGLTLSGGPPRSAPSDRIVMVLIRLGSGVLPVVGAEPEFLVGVVLSRALVAVHNVSGESVNRPSNSRQVGSAGVIGQQGREDSRIAQALAEIRVEPRGSPPT